jgi:hypothetical protein
MLQAVLIAIGCTFIFGFSLVPYYRLFTGSANAARVGCARLNTDAPELTTDAPELINVPPAPTLTIVNAPESVDAPGPVDAPESVDAPGPVDAPEPLDAPEPVDVPDMPPPPSTPQVPFRCNVWGGVQNGVDVDEFDELWLFKMLCRVSQVFGSSSRWRLMSVLSWPPK